MIKRLTKSELQIIEQTKREGEQLQAEEAAKQERQGINSGKPSKARAFGSLFTLVLIFVLMIVVAWLVISLAS